MRVELARGDIIIVRSFGLTPFWVIPDGAGVGFYTYVFESGGKVNAEIIHYLDSLMGER